VLIMSRTPKLFIASSSRAKILAHQLELFLTKRGIDATVWDIDNNSFHSGRSILDGLLHAGRTNDFAAVILTQDDVLTRSDRLLNVPRDNCIFELGFFIGALDLNPARCFFVTSVKEDALPSDIKGYIYYKIDEPKDWNDPEESALCVKKASVNIADQVDKLSSLDRISLEGVRFSVISAEQLIELEHVGRNLVESSEILIQAFRPIETSITFAKRVMRNMENGVTYNYLFPVLDRTAVAIAGMLQTITSAGLDIAEWDTLDRAEKLDKMSDHIDTIARTLETVRYHLFIHFVPHRISEEFCIHNANDIQNMKCYLRWLGKEYFVELEQAQARVKYDAYKSFMHSSLSTIFASTPFIALEQGDIGVQLRSLATQLFPEELRGLVNQALFGR
jgi:hypothetical protein